MSNLKNNNLEDVSKGNDESAPGDMGSSSNKKTRFTKSKSISDVFKELEIKDSNDFETNTRGDFNDSVDGLETFDEGDFNDSVDGLETFDEGDFNDSVDGLETFDEGDFNDSNKNPDVFEDSEDAIIPIHNEYDDLDKSEALNDDSVEGGVILNPLDDSAEANVTESIEYEIDSMENADSIGGDADSYEFNESLSVETDFDGIDGSVDGIDNEDFIAGKDGDIALAEDMKEKIGKSSAQGVLINDKDKASDSEKSFDIFDSSAIISIVGFIVGLGILLIGISYYATSSDRVVDNVLSGETAGLAIFLVIIGLIIIGFSLLKFFSSSKSSMIIDTFNSIKSIDYDDVSEDVISREDFDAVFSIFKRKKDSNFSENDKSVDNSQDLFEKGSDEISEDDISSMYSKSNLTSQKNQSSSKGHESAGSTDDLQYFDEGDDDIVPISSKLNELSDGASLELDENLEDKYSKYDFEDNSDDVFEDNVSFSDDFNLVDDGFEDNVSLNDFNGNDSIDSVEDDLADEDDDFVLIEDEAFDDQGSLEGYDQIDEDSSLEVDNMDGLEDKYAKYDFDDGSDDEMEDAPLSKPKFKKSVDISKFEKKPLSDEELVEQKRIAHEKMLERKKRIIEGTNFDNSLRKQ